MNSTTCNNKFVTTAAFGFSLLLVSALLAQAQTMEMLHEPRNGTRNDFSGVIGGVFMAGSTNIAANIAVTHLGFYDQDEDGLAASHHVGLFTGDGSTLLASVEVPAGTDALLTNGYRWVALDLPLLLIHGSNYLLAAEIGAYDGDLWADQFGPAWNPVFVGTNGGSTRKALWSDRPWPMAPLNGAAGNSIYGAPNLANWQVGPARVVVVQPSVVGYGGQNSTLAVVANGEAPVSLQWYQAPGTLLPGETNSILVITNVTAGDAGNYFVIATNVLGSMQSSNITLTILPDQPVSVTASPTNTSVFELFSATFYVSGTGTLPISYQWQHNGTPIPGATKASYVLAAASLTNAGDQFSCVLSNFANSSPNVVTSGTGTLAVVPNTALPAQYFHEPMNGSRDNLSGSLGNYFQVGDSDTIVTHLGFFDSSGDGLAVSHHVGLFTGDGSTLLASVEVPAGTSAYLGNGYRWMPLSPPLALTNNTYYLLGAEVTSGDGDAWADLFVPTSWNPLFVGTNGASTRSASYNWLGAWPAPPLSGIGAGWAVNGTYGAGNLAMLPLGAPMVVVAPSSITQYQGFQATFTALVSGQPPVDIQWYKAPNTLLSGQTNQALVLSSLSLTDSGNYYAVATNGAGTQRSDSVSLNVLPPTPPQLMQDLQSQTVYLHQGVQLAVTASGTPPLTYLWTYNGGVIPNQTNNTLTLSNISRSQAGNYQVVVSNSYGFTNSIQALVTVLTLPAGSYGAGILESLPLVYFRFTEDPAPGTIATNLGSLGAANNATYEGGCFSTPGPQAPAFPQFETTNTSLGLNGVDADASIPALNLDSFSGHNVTIAAWVNLNGLQSPYTGLVYDRNTPEGASGLAINYDSTGTSNLLMYSWAGNYWQYDSGLLIPTSTWTFVALVVEPNQATLYMQDGTGMQSATNIANHPVVTFGGSTYVGWDDAGALTMRRLTGAVDEAMVFGRALSPQEINMVYLGLPPVNLSIGSAGGNVILTWSSGMLQAAGDVAGPYTNVVSATSPYTNAPNALKKFFRVRVK